MKTNLVKEPLVRFFMISLFLYLLYGFFGKQDTELLAENSTILISKNEISVLENSFQLRYNRSPNSDEKEEFINKLRKNFNSVKREKSEIVDAITKKAMKRDGRKFRKLKKKTSAYDETTFRQYHEQKTPDIHQ